VNNTCVKYLLLLTFVVYGYYNTYAQNKYGVIDSLKNVVQTEKDDSNKVNTLNRLSRKENALNEYDSALSYAESAQLLAEKIGYKKGMSEALNNIGPIFAHRANPRKELEYQLKSLALCRQMGYKKGTAAALTNIGSSYYFQGNYSKALDYDFQALKVAQDAKSNSLIAEATGNIGYIYNDEENYPKALEYGLQALKTFEKTDRKDDIALSLSNLGDVYIAMKDYPKALEYYSNALTISKQVGNNYITATSLNGIGNTYSMQRDYPKALEYYNRGLALAQKGGDKDAMVSSIYVNLGGLYTKLKNYKKGATLLDSALMLSKGIGDKMNIRNAYGQLATLDSALGQNKKSYQDYKQYILYRDSLINQESIKKTTQIELSHEFEKMEDSLKAEQAKAMATQQAEINKRRIITYGVSIVLLFTVLLAALLINRQQKRRKADKLVFEKETTILLSEKERMQSELANAKATLDLYVKDMLEKNKLLEQSIADLENIKNLKSKEIDENRIEQLENLNNTTILTEDDWTKFRELFEQVHKGFFIRLKEKLPNLTQAEVRLICLSKMDLSSKQMTGILGVSTNTIRSLRYRLRKKLGLSEEDSIDDVVNSI